MANAFSKLILQFGDGSPGMQIVNWEEYNYNSDFLTPCDAFTMKVGDKSITPAMRALLLGGQEVQLFMQVVDPMGNTLYTNPIFTGFVDQITIDTSRDGTFFILRGRNILGPLCDSGIDPWSSTYKFVDGQTLGDVMGTVFSAFGITDFYLTDAKNRQITTGVNKVYATLTTSTIQVAHVDVNVAENTITVSDTQTDTQTITQWIDPTNHYDLAEKTIAKLQPLHDQTFMQFVEENLARFSLTCWAMADGSGVVIGAPDYTQEPLYNIINRLDGVGNNVKKGSIDIDPFSMPSAIIAKGYSGGGDFENTRIRTCKVNEFIGYAIGGGVGALTVNNASSPEPLTSVMADINKFNGLEVLTPNETLINNYNQFFAPPKKSKTHYWQDRKSRTLDQLRSAVMRKMSDFQRAGLRLHYIVEDHVQNGIVWKINTIANVYDENLGIINQPWWIMSVHFSKARNGTGTITDLVLIPVGTLVLGPQ